MDKKVVDAVKDSMNYSEKVAPTCGSCKFREQKHVDEWYELECHFNRAVPFKVNENLGRCDNWESKE